MENGLTHQGFEPLRNWKNWKNGIFHIGIRMFHKIIEAFTFASVCLSSVFAFLYLVSPSTLESIARESAFHAEAIDVFAMIFMGFMVFYLAYWGVVALDAKWQSIAERSPKMAKGLFVAGWGTLIVVLVSLNPQVNPQVNHPVPAVLHPVVIKKTRPADRVLLRLWLHHPLNTHHHAAIPAPYWTEKTETGLAKIERMGPGHYQIWMVH